MRAIKAGAAVRGANQQCAQRLRHGRVDVSEKFHTVTHRNTHSPGQGVIVVTCWHLELVGRRWTPGHNLPIRRSTGVARKHHVAVGGRHQSLSICPPTAPEPPPSAGAVQLGADLILLDNDQECVLGVFAMSYPTLGEVNRLPIDHVPGPDRAQPPRRPVAPQDDDRASSCWSK
jgi:hypothetical protein